MCEANVYLLRNDREEMLMESVDIIEPREENIWFLKNIFGEQMEIKGRIKNISLVNHKIVFESEEK